MRFWRTQALRCLGAMTVSFCCGHKPLRYSAELLGVSILAALVDDVEAAASSPSSAVSSEASFEPYTLKLLNLWEFDRNC